MTLRHALFLVAWGAVLALSAGPVVVVTSQSTPAYVRTAVLEAEADTGAFHSTELTALASPSLPPQSAVLDLLWSPQMSAQYLGRKDREVLVVNGNEYSLEGATPLDLDLEVELTQLARVSQWLGMQRLCALLPPQSQLLPLVKTKFEQVEIDAVRVAEDAQYAAMEVLVRKQIAPLGFTSFLVMLPPLPTKRLLLAFHSSQLTDSRLTFLLSSKAAVYRFDVAEEELLKVMYLRPLYVTGRECYAAGSYPELLHCQTSLAVSAPDYSEITLMQIANRTAHLVAWLHEDSIDLSNYQEAQIQPNSSEALTTIGISINSGRENPSGLSSVNPIIGTSGAFLALEEVNSDHSLLQYFRVSAFQASFGIEELNLAWIKGQIEKSDLGVALLDGLFSSVAIGTYEVLRGMNYSIPQVGATLIQASLSSRSDFPLFTRVSMSDAYIAVIYGRMMKQFGWINMCILFDPETWDEGISSLLVEGSKTLGITIRLAPIPPETHPNSTALAEVLQTVVDSQVRVLVIMAYRKALVSVLVGLYDLGMRSGDLMLVAVDWLFPELYDTNDTEQLAVIQEMTQGAIMFDAASFVGAVGASYVQRFLSSFGVSPHPYSCFFYDAALKLIYALDDLVAHGQDWNSPFNLNKAIRDARFIGCTGFVSTEDLTNDRALMSYNIFNARVQSDGTMRIEAIGTYDPSSTVLFTFTEPILWPGNTTTVPRDMRENVPGCPFERKHAYTYRPAKALSTTLIMSICAISVTCSVCLWRKYWNFGIKPLRRRSQASFEDYFVFIVIGVESLQYMAVGLQLEDWTVFIQWSARLSAVRYEAFASVGSSAYWCILCTAIAVVATWMLLLSLAKVRTNHYCRCVCAQGEVLAQLLCPLIGDVLFVPIVSILLSIFQCPKVSAKPTEVVSLRKTYLEWDCHQFCWDETHLPFALVSLACVFIYIPSATYMRPAWQHVSISLHIHSSPSFLMVKSMYQVLVIGVDRAFKTESPLEVAVVFVVLTTLFALSSLRVRPFSYSRANLWHFLSLLFVLYTAVLHVACARAADGSSVLWLVLLYSGLTLGFVFGLVYQAAKLPPKLISAKSIEVPALFRFMFSRGGRYLHIFSRVNNLSSGDDLSGTVHRVPEIKVMSAE